MAVDYTSAVRDIRAQARFYNSSGTYVTNLRNYLIQFEIQRVAEDTKFFGQVITQRLSIKFLNTTTPKVGRYIQLELFTDVNEIETPFPHFHISQVNTDDVNRTVTATAYDWLKQTEEATVDDLALTVPYTIGDFLNAIAVKYGHTYSVVNIAESALNTSYAQGANLDGKESLKDCLGWIAEVLGAIVYVDNTDTLIIKRLSKDGEADFTIDKDNYFKLTSGANKRLAKVISVTELGDNIEAHTTESGSTQVIRNNPFIEARSNPEAVVNNLINVLGGITLAPFELEWKGNPNIQIGDKLTIAAKDTSTITSFLLDEVINYDGGLSSKMRYHWDENKEEDTFANPSTIGDAIYSTYAKVDKINKQISLVVSDVEAIETTQEDLINHLSNIDLRNMFINSKAERTLYKSTTDYKLSDYGVETVLNGSKITISFDAISTEADTIVDMYPRYNPDSPTNHSGSVNKNFFTIGTEWARYSKTLTMPTASYPWVSWRFRSNTSVTGGSGTAHVTYKNVKLELGETATPYTVAPEDIESGLETAQENITTIQSSVSSLTQTANEINATVTSIQADVDGLGTNLQEAIDSTNTTINSIQQQVNAKVTSTDVSLAISEALSNGVDSVTTSTGYRFDKDGLTISKSNSDISTQIDNEGMRVSTQFEDVLTATNSGVNALNLTARNFLIIGTRSRLQDYGTDQTGIFWIGD